MIFAAISHIAGDRQALDLVLSELREQGVQVIVNTGDTAGIATESGGAIERIQAAKIATVQGALDRRIIAVGRKPATLEKRLDPADFAAAISCQETLSSSHLEWLASQPKSRVLQMDQHEVALCHGTWNQAGRYLSADDSDDWFRRQRELQIAPVFVLGGPGPAFAREIDGTLFVHPGPVHSEDGAPPQYALISLEELPATATLCQV